MLKKLLIGTAVSGLMLSAALAQSSMSPSAPNASPNASQSGLSNSPAKQDKSDMSKTSGSASSSSSANFIAEQKADQLLATKVKGTNVIGPDNAKIGDISDIMFTKDGKIDAFIVSVGGFLGMGSKDVALAPSSLQIAQDEKNNLKISVSLTKDQLKQAPEFKTLKSQSSTMGSAGGSSSSPSSSPARNTMPPPK
ncbi:MAG TPA: PRC-barrel domain-containing protein [Xanthobacteraceae bacterium]|nr:PRC-barrel domain-containing protein [Xanthobacteraceae bacterium]